MKIKQYLFPYRLCKLVGPLCNPIITTLRYSVNKSHFFNILFVYYDFLSFLVKFSCCLFLT